MSRITISEFYNGGGFFEEEDAPEPEQQVEQCCMCENYLPADCVRKSEDEGGTYCTEGIDNCWDIVKEECENNAKEEGDINYKFK